MVAKLPGWVLDDVTSVRAEVAEWEGLGAADLWQLARLCAKDALWAVRASGHAERVLSASDPLPPSTVAALLRLRRDAGWGSGRR